MAVCKNKTGKDLDRASPRQGCAKFCSHSQKRFSKWRPVAILNFVKSNTCPQRYFQRASVCSHIKFHEGTWPYLKHCWTVVISDFKIEPLPFWISLEIIFWKYRYFQHICFCQHRKFGINIAIRFKDTVKTSFNMVHGCHFELLKLYFIPKYFWYITIV